MYDYNIMKTLPEFMLLLQWCRIGIILLTKRLPNNKNSLDTVRFFTINHLLPNTRSRDKEKQTTCGKLFYMQYNNKTKTNKQTPWPKFTRELCQLSDRR
jgi:hypothetical protein